MNKCYRLDGETISEVHDFIEWAKWYETANRSIADDMVGESRISTIFLGLDHSYGDTPILFETMVFGGPLDGEQKRWYTLEEAREGHKATVRNALDSKQGE